MNIRKIYVILIQILHVDARKGIDCMTQTTNTQNTPIQKYGNLIKLLQIAAGIVILLSVVGGVVLIRKYDLSVSNLGTLKELITGGTWTIIAGIILFSVVKSFALIIPPALIFAFTGLLLDNVVLAMAVNFVATFLSLFLPFALGRFAGKPMLDKLKVKSSKVRKIDDFAHVNDFASVFLIKVSGIIASDLSSLIFGAMGIRSKTHLIASILGLLPLNIVWTLLGAYADLTDPKSALFLLPVIALAVVGTLAAKKLANKNKPEAQTPTSA